MACVYAKQNKKEEAVGSLKQAMDKEFKDRSIIAKDPEKFGFGSIQYDEPLKFIEARVPSATPLKVIAKIASMEVDDLFVLPSTSLNFSFS